MIATAKLRIVALLTFLCVSNLAFSQWSDGPFMSIAGQAGMPLNKEYKPYSWAAGGIGKFALPLGQQDYCTLSLNAISCNGSDKGKSLKERDILSALVGYRYDFRKEDSYSFFFMEPQIGWSFVGTDYNSFCYMPTVGYSLNSKVDFSAFYFTTTSSMRPAKSGIAGIMVAYNFHFAKRGD